MVQDITTPKPDSDETAKPLLTPISTRSLKTSAGTDERLTNVESHLDKITSALEQSLIFQEHIMMSANSETASSQANTVHVSYPQHHFAPKPASETVLTKIAPTNNFSDKNKFTEIAKHDP